VTICYGMTETSPVSFQSSIEDPLERRVSTVGRIHPIWRSRSSLSTATPSRGHTGGTLHPGLQRDAGYWGDETRTHEASMPTAGCIPATWRLSTPKAIAISLAGSRHGDRGGENIYPREIEEYLYRHPDILDVQVVGCRIRNMARRSAPGLSRGKAPAGRGAGP